MIPLFNIATQAAMANNTLATRATARDVPGGIIDDGTHEAGHAVLGTGLPLMLDLAVILIKRLQFGSVYVEVH